MPEFIEPGTFTAAEVRQIAEEEQSAEQLAAQELQEAPAQAAPKVSVIKAAQKAAQWVVLSETDTRKLIDEQLRQAGWEADTERLTYGAGVRREKGRNLAIAEWPLGERGPITCCSSVLCP